jgi:hypothetical protein
LVEVPLIVHLALALMWWWWMPAGFPFAHPRFGVSDGCAAAAQNGSTADIARK